MSSAWQLDGYRIIVEGSHMVIAGNSTSRTSFTRSRISKSIRDLTTVDHRRFRFMMLRALKLTMIVMFNAVVWRCLNPGLLGNYRAI